MRPPSRRAGWVAGMAVLAGLLWVPASRGVRSLGMTRRAVATYVAVLAAADAEDLGAVRRLCSARLLREDPPSLAPGGGLVGLPRGIHKNFRAWREGDEARLCPTDRVGPVYRFTYEDDGACRFDGLAGLLRGGGRFEPAAEAGGDSL